MRSHRAEQHLFSRLLLPVVHGLVVMTVVGQARASHTF